MDTDTLVADQIDSGQELITLLAETGFDVTAACWIKSSDDGRWFLYIASEDVDRSGLVSGYRKVYDAFKFKVQDWDFISEVKLIGKEDSIAREILEIQQRFPGKVPTRPRKLQLVSIPSEEVYIYPPRTPPPAVEGVWPRLSYRVTYHRQGETDNWRARTKKEVLYRGMKAKGAVAYSSARREGEKEGDENFAIVSVLLEVDPKFDDENVFIHPGVWQVLRNQARQVADEMFKSRHPEAVIEHLDED
jgi:hypothetical protein